MPKPNKLTDKLFDTIIKRYETETLSSIMTLAVEYDIAKSVIYRRMKEKGIKPYKFGWRKAVRVKTKRYHDEFYQIDLTTYCSGSSKYKRKLIRKNLMLKQDCKCAICKKELNEGTAHIDHCHKTGKTRELLCVVCNTGLGRFKDNIRIMESAVDYLKKHKPRFRFYLSKGEKCSGENHAH